MKSRALGAKRRRRVRMSLQVPSTLFALMAFGAACGAGDISTPETEAVFEQALQDNTPPSIDFTSPAEGANVSGTVAVTGTASDNQRLKKVEVLVGTGPFRMASGTTNWTFSLNTTTLAAGTHRLVARATDQRGLTRMVSRNINVSSGPVTQPTAGKLEISKALTLDRQTARAGETVTGTVSFRNTGGTAVNVQQMIIAGRPPGADIGAGPFWDFAPQQGARTVQPGEVVTVQGSRTVTAADAQGSYVVFATFQDGAGAWTKGPDVALSVSSTPSCQPTTCQAQGKNCGSISDGCGGTLTCGSCGGGQTCGGGGQANVCGGGTTAPAGFIGVDRSSGTFTLNGRPFYFGGTNAYYMMQTRTYGSSETVDALNAAQATGMKVVRTWGFADGYAWTNSNDPAILQMTPGVYREQAFQAMDFVIAEAKRRGLYLIIALVNNWDAYGGMNQYVRWAGASGHDAFYTNDAVKQLYKNFVRDFLNRRNTLTGVLYKDEPAIMSWELANEARCTSDGGTSRRLMTNWLQEMAAYVKSIDPNHLISTGEEGFDSTTNGYSNYANKYVLGGSEGTSFTQNTALQDIDFGGVHLYPEAWNLTIAEGNGWISDHTRIARSLGKPMIVGEYGSPTRSIYQNWLGTVESAQTGGALLWELVPQSRGAHEPFDVLYPNDSAEVSVIQSHNQRMNAR